MPVYLSLVIILPAIAGIFALRPLTAKIKTVLHPHPLVDYQIKFQSLQLLLALLTLLVVYRLNAANFVRFFRVGDLQAHISAIAWLGVTGEETWMQIMFTLGFFITLATAIFMFLQLKKANIFGAGPGLGAAGWQVLAWAAIFSIANAFSEEAIFRMGIVSPLSGRAPVPVIILISGIFFGVPHYFGQPRGLVGVLMAGFLGWLLALSLVETQGLFVAWAIHFVQDVVIITSILLMSKHPL